jgi:hypothetical protein
MRPLSPHVLPVVLAPWLSTQIVPGLYGQEQQAVRDLGLQFADYKTQAQRNLAGAYQVGMQEAGKEFSYNQWYPSQVRLNMGQQRMNAGQQNLWGGIDQMAGAGLDFATAYVGQNQGNVGQVNTTPAQTSALQGNANNQPLPYNLSANRLAPAAQGAYMGYGAANMPRFGTGLSPSAPAPYSAQPYNVYGTDNLLYNP